MAESLIEKWRSQLDAVSAANQWDTESELAWLAEQASSHDSILELGAFLGASTKIMALANPKAKIVVIDAWHDEGTREKFQGFLDPEIKEGRVTAIHANTSEGFKHIPEGFVPDFVFIDAGHLYDDVKGDIENVGKLMERAETEPSNLVISGHDYRHNLPQDGVTKAVNEAFQNVYFPADSIWAANISCPRRETPEWKGCTEEDKPTA